MEQIGRGLLIAALAAVTLAGQEDTPVFRSDVTLVRVDAQVVDRGGQRIQNLRREDFRLTVDGRPAELSAFATEQIPLDLVLLIDVSGSMRPHVERIAAGMRSALRALGPDDQVAVMAFDRQTRVHLHLEGDHDRVAGGMQALLEEERFNSGTAITRALKQSAQWLESEARPDSRRAVVILTDDESGDRRDDDGVLSALDRSGAALSVLMAPPSERGRRGGGGIGWPAGRRGGIILGRRLPIPRPQVSMMDSAGVREIARQTGGDTFRVEDSDALTMTFERLRQRYALFYSDATGRAPVEITLSEAAQRRYPGARVEYRRSGRWGGGAEPPVLSERSPVRTPEGPGWGQGPDDVDERAPSVAPPPPPPSTPPSTAPAAQERKGGWRKATPEDLKPAPPPALSPRKP